MNTAWQVAHGGIRLFHHGMHEGYQVSLVHQAVQAGKTAVLVIPALYKHTMDGAFELELDALRNGEPFLSEFILVCNRIVENGEPVDLVQKRYDELQARISGLPYPSTLIRVDSERMQNWIVSMGKMGLPILRPSKGLNVWIAAQYLAGKYANPAYALVDSDITPFSVDIAARLLAPVISPLAGVQFTKGLQNRVTPSSIYGRAKRLVVDPMVIALWEKFPDSDFVRYLTAQEYLLAGEMGFGMPFCQIMPIGVGYGLELGFAAAAAKFLNVYQRAEVQIREPQECHDQDHQPIKHDSGKGGLVGMAKELFTVLVVSMLQKGRQINDELLNALRMRRFEIAGELIKYQWASMSAFGNFYRYDVNAEREANVAFDEAIGEAVSEIRDLLDTGGYSDLVRRTYLPSTRSIVAERGGTKAINDLVDIIEEQNGRTPVPRNKRVMF